MKHHAILLAVAAIAAFSLSALGETRGKPLAREQLLERSSRVFVGEVLEARTFDKHNRTVPTKVRVLLAIKGDVAPGERQVIPKDPGLHAYFDEEFAHATPGQFGVFYVGDNRQPDVLLGYRDIPLEKAKPKGR